MVERAIAWLVRGNRKVRYRGVAKNDDWSLPPRRRPESASAHRARADPQQHRLGADLIIPAQ
jgi:hypothetical protein